MRFKVIKKVNFVVLAVIVLLFAAYTYKIKSRNPETIEVNVLIMENNGQLSGQYIPPPIWLVDSVKVGDKEMGLSNKTYAEIVGIDSYEEGVNKIANAHLRLLVSKDGDTYLYKQKKLMVGSIVNFSLGKTTFLGKVTAVNVKNDTVIHKVVTVRLYNRRDWFADAIKIGDRTEMVEVLDKRVTDTELGGGFSSSPVYKGNKDIELKVSIKANEWGGQWFFANYQPLKIGNDLWIPMNKYNLYNATVVDVKDES